jgi:hypothetical protein
MKKQIAILLLLIIFISGCSLEDDTWIKQEVFVDEFHKIESDIDADIFFTQSNYQGIFVEGYEVEIDRLDFYVRNNKLIIDQKGKLREPESLIIDIHVPDLSLIEQKGDGAIVGLHEWYVQDIKLENRGHGIIDFKIFTEKIEIKIREIGDIFLSGNTYKLEADLKSEGSLYGIDLQCDKAFLDIHDFGDVELSVYDYLDVKIDGAGSCYYCGNPSINLNRSGSGELIRIR